MFWPSNRLGYTPLEEAKAASDVKVIDSIEQFRSSRTLGETTKENIVERSTIIDNTKSTGQLQKSVSELSDRVNFLESLLTEVSKIGDTLKSQSTADKIENPETLKELGEKLSAMKPATNENSTTAEWM